MGEDLSKRLGTNCIELFHEKTNFAEYMANEIESPYGGIFFYGVHLVQPVTYIFGDDIKVVKINKYEKSRDCPDF